MADDTERLVLEMSADLRRFQNSLDRANNAADRRFSALEKRATATARNVERSFSGMGDDIRNALAAIGVGVAVREVGQYADAWTRTANQLAAAGVVQDRVAATQDRIVDIAKETRSEFSATARLYASLTRASAEFGASQVEVARVTETVNKALAASGASTAERASAILQLAQGLSSGVLQGDELRSLRESSPVLAKAIADEFNTTVGGLKKLGAEGELTADRVFRAILKGSTAVDAQFAKTRSTIADAFTTLQTEAIRYIGQADAATSASAKLAGFILVVANNLDLLAQAAVVAGTAVGGVLLGRGIVALIAGTQKAAVGLGITNTALQATGVRAVAAAAGMRSLSIAMAFLGGPWGVAITAIGVGMAYLAKKTEEAKQPTAEFTKQSAALTTALGKYEEAALNASTATGKEAEAKRRAAEATRKAVELEIQNTRAKLASAEATLKLIEAENLRLEQQAKTDPASFGAEDPFSGMAGASLKNSREFQRATANRKQALDDIAAGEKKLAEIRKALSGGGGAGKPAGGSGGKGSKRTGPTPAEIRQEVDLEAARVAENLDLERSLERQVFLRDQARRYSDAGLKSAEASRRALEDAATLEDARQTAAARRLLDIQRATELEEARVSEDEAGIRSLERKIDLQDRVNAYTAAGFDLATATTAAQRDSERLESRRVDARRRILADLNAEHTLEVARLGGEEERVKLLERELFIRERSLELQREAGLAPAAATAQATREVGELAQAELRGRFRAAFRDGVRAAIEGDLGGFLQSMTADIAERLLGKSLDVIADSLFSTVAEAFPELLGQVSGDALGAASAAATISTAIATSGTAAGATMATAVSTGGSLAGVEIATAGATAAGTMGAAIVSAGAQAAATMAAAIASGNAASAAASAGSSFGGFFASGGGGRFPILNERGAEAMIQSQPGVVFSTAAMKGLADLGRLAKQGRVGGGGDTSITIVNALGVEATSRRESSPDGGTKITLEPVARKMLESAGRSGVLADAARKSPPRRMRG